MAGHRTVEHIGESLDIRKQEENEDKLKWLIEHPDPVFEYFLDQYVAGRNLGLKQNEARAIAQRMVKEHFNRPDITTTNYITIHNIT